VACVFRSVQCEGVDWRVLCAMRSESGGLRLCFVL